MSQNILYTIYNILLQFVLAIWCNMGVSENYDWPLEFVIPDFQTNSITYNYESDTTHIVVCFPSSVSWSLVSFIAVLSSSFLFCSCLPYPAALPSLTSSGSFPLAMNPQFPFYLKVSINGINPKSCNEIGCSIINHPAIGVPTLMETTIWPALCSEFRHFGDWHGQNVTTSIAGRWKAGFPSWKIHNFHSTSFLKHIILQIIYSLVNVYITMENNHFWWVNQV